MQASGLSKGRLSQLLDPSTPFGDVAARNLEERLQLEPGYFDAMDERTVKFAAMFDQLPAEAKDQWEALLAVIGRTR